MVKLVYCITRRSDLEPGEFRRIWLHEHGALVRSFADALRASRYVQSHAVDSALNDALAGSRGMQPGYDGITELWFESLEQLTAALGSPQGVAAAASLLEDEKRFIDHGRSRLFVTEEHPIF